MDSPPGSRVDPTAAPSTGPGSPGYVAPASPTGQALLPQSWVRPAMTVGVVCAAIAGVPIVIGTAGLAVPVWLAVVGGLSGSVALLISQLGIGSPGLRKPPQ